LILDSSRKKQKLGRVSTQIGMTVVFSPIHGHILALPMRDYSIMPSVTGLVTPRGDSRVENRREADASFAPADEEEGEK